jgi:CheY-like chemotaxis protein
MVFMSDNVGVLIVDDDVGICSLVSRMFKKFGVSSHCVFDGVSALAWLAAHRAKLVLLDLSMPGMSGAEVLQQIRKNDDLADLPVVLHSAQDVGEVEFVAKRYGANGIMLKGRYAMADLVEMIDRFGLRSEGSAGDTIP